MRATPLRALVDRRFPGCPNAESVDYVAVAALAGSAGGRGKRLQPPQCGPFLQISGDPHVDGDGLVPVSSALLRDARLRFWRTRLMEDCSAAPGTEVWIGSRPPDGARERSSPRSLESNHAISHCDALVVAFTVAKTTAKKRRRQRGSVALVTAPAGVAALASANQASESPPRTGPMGRDPDIEASRPNVRSLLTGRLTEQQ